MRPLAAVGIEQWDRLRLVPGSTPELRTSRAPREQCSWGTTPIANKVVGRLGAWVRIGEGRGGKRLDFVCSRVPTTAPTTALTTLNGPPAVYVSVVSVTLTLVSGHVVVSGLVWGVRGVFGEFSTHSSDRILASIWFDSGYLYRFRPLPFPHSPAGIPTHTRTPPNPACGFCRLSPGELSAESIDL